MAVHKNSAIEILFNEGWEQKDIAQILRLSEATISKHVVKRDLRQRRTMSSLAKKTSEDNALFALEHQSTIIRLMAASLKQELGKSTDIESLKNALIPRGEVDALQKLFTTIKSKELEWSAIVKVIREFITFLKERDIELAQSIVDHVDDYINEKRRYK